MMEIPEGFYLKGYKVPIYPTEMQKEFIDRCIDVNIYVYNWALEQENIQFGKWKDGESDKRFLTTYDLDKMYTELRSSVDWFDGIPHTSGRSSIRRVTDGFNKFFKGICRSPKYKSKKKMSKFSYKTRADRMFFEDNMLRIEGLPKDDMIYTKYHSGWNKKENPHFYCCVVSINQYVPITIVGILSSWRANTSYLLLHLYSRSRL